MINSRVSHTPFGMIALILVLRYATLTNTNLETSPENAVGQACAQYLDSEWDVKIDTWLGVSARTEGEIIAFINSVPWDMAAQAENVVTSQ
ncbi:hypothetical protein B0H16DRAFT_1560111 [Mycena metata]|uniref:Uncharacterized protein n=1 Tax=Mycena metata TaxID=1033252 RepID=A0AAD7IKR6_9AGAR|nr:hypothetical protein B0H16DRAFT_1560111 [Mycena metata]